MCPIIKSLFHEHTLKYAEVVEDCTVMSDLRGKQKLHLGIQMLITARALEGTIINYIYSCSPWKGGSFGGDPIYVKYSKRKLQYAIEKQAIKSYKNSQKLLMVWY